MSVVTVFLGLEAFRSGLFLTVRNYVCFVSTLPGMSKYLRNGGRAGGRDKVTERVKEQGAT